MQERIFDFISATFGASFAIVLVVIGVVIWLTHYITKKVTVINSSHDKITKGIEKSEANIDEIRRDLAYIKGTIDIAKAGTTPFMQSHSPISLTDEGKKVAMELKAEGIILSNWDKIRKDLLNKDHKTAYDIQTYCIETASVSPSTFFDDCSIVLVKDFAFKEGKPLQLYLRLLGLLIRDKYFEEEGIPLSRIDETAPEK
ncbi:hypothetical protein HQ36_01990 [Porphyromonas gingivicanis]|uniref:Uncharacterized protein n=1 Tax=Porphyromonas gingivicanis TaxID=266762 RepID=A0A0A2G573_9PORP|nr:hypothetical protein [Porphyromonas gingivicanis]KGN98408.1 hypothetical protein HQ36_01990 [Porphyromonas gingivicanis]